MFLVEVVVPRDHLHRGASTCQVSNDAVLDATVDRDDLHITRSVCLRFRSGYLGHQVTLVGIDEVERSHPRLSQSRKEGSLLSDTLGESAGVHPLDGRDSLPLQPVAQRTLPFAMRPLLRVL